MGVLLITVASWPLASFSQRALGGEPICPGESTADPNVIFCDDFETGDWSRWGHGPSSDRLAVSPQKPFLGGYSAQYQFDDLRQPGYQDIGFPGVEELRIRFYIYFEANFHWGFGYSDHMLFIGSTGGTTCGPPGTPGGLDWGPWGPLIYRSENCNGTRHNDLRANMGPSEDRILRNLKWYRIELYMKVNSIGGCADQNGNGAIDSEGECDGSYEIWVEDRQVAGYYTLNYRGNDNPNYRLNGFLFNHYFRTGGQAYNGVAFNEYRDNLVVMNGSNGGSPIGPAPNEPTSMGTPDVMSPYKTETYKEWFAFDSGGNAMRPGADCAWGQALDNGWFHSSSPSGFVVSPAHNSTVGPCNGNVPAGNDKALIATTLTGHDYSGAGTDGTMGMPGGAHVIHGWMYLDPGSFPAPNGAALSGFIYYQSGAARNYIAMGVDAANHPTLLRQFDNMGAPPFVLATNSDVTITSGDWHRFELRGTEQGRWSVRLDGAEVLNASGVADATLWSQTASDGGVAWAFHYGISDHLSNPAPLTVYYDDISIGTTSFEDCFGWNPSICPFNDASRADAVAPSVSITAPANGATVSGAAVTVTATASDDIEVVGVQFQMDGVDLGAEDTSAPYSVSWDSTQVPTGAHTLTAVARDAAGNLGSDSVTVTVVPASVFSWIPRWVWYALAGILALAIILALVERKKRRR